jgi:hypothetical protein
VEILWMIGGSPVDGLSAKKNLADLHRTIRRAAICGRAFVPRFA